MSDRFESEGLLALTTEGGDEYYFHTKSELYTVVTYENGFYKVKYENFKLLGSALESSLPDLVRAVQEMPPFQIQNMIRNGKIPGIITGLRKDYSVLGIINFDSVIHKGLNGKEPSYIASAKVREVHFNQWNPVKLKKREEYT